MRRALALGLLALPFALAGCPDRIMYLAAQCSDPVGVGDDPTQLPRACATSDAGIDAGGDCECVQVPGKWSGPTWLWYGPVEQAPSCEGESFFEGYTDFVSGGACEICTCEPPTGSCELPSQLTVSTKACNNIPAGSSSSFNAPLGWAGECDGATHVPPGIAHSLTVAPIEMVEDGCHPGPPVPAKVIAAHGTTFAIGCHGQGWTVCGDVTRSACVAHDDVPPPGFRLCIFNEGVRDCPANVSFTQKLVFYDGANEECSDCGCDLPVGSVCKAKISVYEDGLCGGPTFLQLPISSVAPVCVDIAPPGQSLGSKSAGSATYFPGTCQPHGGKASGVITGINPSTFCCRP